MMIRLCTTLLTLTLAACGGSGGGSGSSESADVCTPPEPIETPLAAEWFSVDGNYALDLAAATDDGQWFPLSWSRTNQEIGGTCAGEGRLIGDSDGGLFFVLNVSYVQGSAIIGHEIIDCYSRLQGKNYERNADLGMLTFRDDEGKVVNQWFDQ